MISVKDKKADKESIKERFGGEGGPPSFTRTAG